MKFGGSSSCHERSICGVIHERVIDVIVSPNLQKDFIENMKYIDHSIISKNW